MAITPHPGYEESIRECIPLDNLFPAVSGFARHHTVGFAPNAVFGNVMDNVNPLGA